MKKLLTLIAVLALTAPVFADTGDPNVTISCTDEGGGVVAVYYTLEAHDGFVPGDDPLRGIALKISTSNTADIDAISDYATGSVPADSTQIPLGFSVFPGSIVIGPQDPNFVTDFGDPVAPSTDPGAGDDLPNAAEIVVELGTLYTGDNAPPATGMLFKLTLGDNGESSTDLTIEGESTRGGDQGEAVLESGQQANVVSSGCTVTFEPACWSFPCFSCGDYDGDGNITYLEDVQPLIDAWGNYYDPCCDKNKDGNISYVEDVQPIIDYWPGGCPTVCPDPS